MDKTTNNNAYQARMQKKKDVIDKRIQEANINKAIIVLLTGNGKGKSSSALGMISRTLGWGGQVGVVKFLKGKQQTGEDLFFANHQKVQTIWMQTGFTWDTQNQEYDTQKAQEAWSGAKKFLQNPQLKLVVLDEITYMLNYGYLDEKEVIASIKNRPQNQNVVITGRAASKALMNIADTISEIKDTKHAFRANIQAQKGIDY